ncbi:MAG: sarcosine oxidase subunit gamma [Pseudomonadota bacterium]
MADLTPTTPCAGLGLPLDLGDVILVEVEPESITAITPFPSTRAAADAALREKWGLGLPAPGETAKAGDDEIRWAGLDEVWFLGPGFREVHDTLSGHAAITDVSDGWARLLLTGPASADVLRRLMPVDPSALSPGQTVRTQLAHMMASVTARESGFEVMAMRSFAGSLVHDIEAAMRSVIAQSSLE